MTVAYIRADDSSWNLSQNNNQILSANAEDLFFADGLSGEEIVEHFKTVFPPSHPDLTSFDYDTSNPRPRTIEPLEVEELRTRHFLGQVDETAAYLAELAKAAGKIRCDLYWSSPTQNKLLKHGCVCIGHCITYDPKGADAKLQKVHSAKKRQKRLEKKNYPGAITDHLQRVTWNAEGEVQKLIDTRLATGKSHKDSILKCCRACRLVDLICGENAHRHLHFWNGLMGAWRKDRARAKAWFKKNGHLYGELAAAVRWLDREAREKPRKPKALRIKAPKLFRGQKDHQ